MLKNIKHHNKLKTLSVPITGTSLDKSCIYAWFNLDSKLWYIGKTHHLRLRIRQHWNMIKRRIKKLPVDDYKYKSIVSSKKYSSFFFVKLEEFNSTLRKNDSKLYDKQLLQEEKRYIKLHRPSLNA